MGLWLLFLQKFVGDRKDNYHHTQNNNEKNKHVSYYLAQPMQLTLWFLINNFASA
jgi:hypothetical protein